MIKTVSELAEFVKVIVKENPNAPIIIDYDGPDLIGYDYHDGTLILLGGFGDIDEIEKKGNV